MRINMKRPVTQFFLVLAVLLIAGPFAGQAHAVVSQSIRCGGINILSTPGCTGYVGDGYYWNSTDGLNGSSILYSASTYAIPMSADTPATFISFMSGELGSGSSYTYNKSGAAFIIETMLGHLGGSSASRFGTATAMIAQAQTDFTTWSNLVTAYGTANAISWGTGAAVTLATGEVNTTHVCPLGTPGSDCNGANMSAGNDDAKDFAYYNIASTDSPETAHEIIFTGSNGSYIIRRECGNPLGQMSPLSAYALTPSITPKVNGASASLAQVGDTIVFTYAIDNSTAYNSSSVSCTTYAQTFSGYHATVGTGEVLSGGGPATTCPTTINSKTNPTIATETVTATTGNTTICRSLYITPYSPTQSGSAGTEACVVVAAKPYVKVFGGDVAAGSAFASSGGTCTDDSNAQIISWNNQTSGYPGSGSQYAALALNAITDFATNQNASGASAPSSLAFANTTASGASIFGGTFGTSNNCIPDYYDQKGTTTNFTGTTIPTTNGAYLAASGITLTGGTITGGQNVQLYVNGDVYINGNIKYSTTGWTAGNIPLFEIIAKGNIYIDSNVSEIDGLYIAQQNGGTGGTIYTCATGPGAPASVASSTYFNTCDKSKLTVNGSLIGNEVQLLRTTGSLDGSSTSETPASNNAGESVNYGPAFWITQPVSPSTGGGSGADDYNSLTSLPPIL